MPSSLKQKNNKKTEFHLMINNFSSSFTWFAKIHRNFLVNFLVVGFEGNFYFFFMSSSQFFLLNSAMSLRLCFHICYSVFKAYRNNNENFFASIYLYKKNDEFLIENKSMTFEKKNENMKSNFLWEFYWLEFMYEYFCIFYADGSWHGDDFTIFPPFLKISWRILLSTFFKLH